jgi:hypothetical protein
MVKKFFVVPLLNFFFINPKGKNYFFASVAMKLFAGHFGIIKINF